MATETTLNGQQPVQQKVIHRGGASEAVYGLGLIGALVYYLGHATTFWLGVLGFLKAIVWPAMLIYEVFRMLNM